MFIGGIPAPQGSKNAYARGNQIVLVEASKKLKPWRDKCRQAFKIAAANNDINTEGLNHEVALKVCLTFHLAKPKTVLRLWPTVKPDLDKLTRAVLDAATGVVWHDDSQVIELIVRKVYAISEPGVLVIVEPLKKVFEYTHTH